MRNYNIWQIVIYAESLTPSIEEMCQQGLLIGHLIAHVEEVIILQVFATDVGVSVLIAHLILIIIINEVPASF